MSAPEPDLQTDPQTEPAPVRHNGSLTIAAWVTAVLVWPAGIVLALLAKGNGQRYRGPLITALVVALLSITGLTVALASHSTPSALPAAHLQSDVAVINQVSVTVSTPYQQPAASATQSTKTHPPNNTYVNAAATYLFGTHSSTKIVRSKTNPAAFTFTHGSQSACLTTSLQVGQLGVVTPGRCH